MADSLNAWIKAKRCHASSACVEMTLGSDGVVMRNSRHPDDHIRHTMTEFAIFLEAAKNGEFDHLVSTEPTS
jgi:Domain of unknown function (DUF397)